MKLTAIKPTNIQQYKKINIQTNTTQQKISEPTFKSWYTNYDVEKYKQDFSKQLKERKQEIFAHLDSLTTTTMENGRKGNVTDILRTFFTEEREYTQVSGLMHKTPRENIKPIIENGFDFLKSMLQNMDLECIFLQMKLSY